MPSNNIYQKQFTPTWLYIKKHNITGLKYFGKTVSQDPHKYPGSGIYWSKHIKKHGNDVSTIWCHLYHDEDELVADAISFSIHHNIISDLDTHGNKVWANLMIETGRGKEPGQPISLSTREKLISARKRQKRKPISQKEKERLRFIRSIQLFTDETKQKMSESKMGDKNHFYGKTHTDESKLKMSHSQQNRIRREFTEEEKREISEKISNKLKGVAKTDEHKEKISKSLIGKNTGENNPFYGKTHSEETKRKISESNKGKAPYTLSETHKQNISKSKQHISEETRKKLSEATKQYWIKKREQYGG